MRFAILTPDPNDAAYADRWRDAYEAYRATFAAHGVETIPAPWTEAWPSDVDAVLAVRAWGYHKRSALWLETLKNTPIKLINPSAALLWNTDKHYLAGMAEAGVPIAPTRFIASFDQAALDAAFIEFDCAAVVAKPTISAGAWHTHKLNRGDHGPAIPGGAMIQPFLEAVQGEGELSLFYFGSRLSHAARKVATAGDFRVQPQYGGALSLFDPDAEMLGLAARVLTAAPQGLAYARVDMIRDRDGVLKLMELEIIEPDLYLDLDPGAAGRFVEGVLAAV